MFSILTTLPVPAGRNRWESYLHILIISCIGTVSKATARTVSNWEMSCPLLYLLILSYSLFPLFFILLCLLLSFPFTGHATPACMTMLEGMFFYFLISFDFLFLNVRLSFFLLFLGFLVFLYGSCSFSHIKLF